MTTVTIDIDTYNELLKSVDRVNAVADLGFWFDENFGIHREDHGVGVSMAFASIDVLIAKANFAKIEDSAKSRSESRARLIQRREIWKKD